MRVCRLFPGLFPGLLLLLLADAALAQTKGIFINEFMARNKTGIKDQKGQVEDWLELYNGSTTNVDVGGMYLTDDATTPTEWKIPATTIMPPGGTLLIWLDDDPGDGPMHATFKLAGAGEQVFLFDKDGKTQVDGFTFGEQADDVSTGRLFDGQAQWVTFSESTPRAPNAPIACGSRPFSALKLGAHRVRLALTGSPKVNSKITFHITDAPANSNVLLFLGAGAAGLDLGLGVTLLLQAPLIGPFPLPTNANGAFNLPITIPNDARLAGSKTYLQVGAADSQGLTASNARELIICR